MGSAYALSTFLRQTPKSLLQRYFVANGLLEEVPFDELRPRDTATVTEALNRLEPVVIRCRRPTGRRRGGRGRPVVGRLVTGGT